MHSTQQMSAVGGNMGFSTPDWVALFIFGVSALVGTFGKSLVRIIGLAVMPLAVAGLILSLSHHGNAPGQGPISDNTSTINTNNANQTTKQSGGTNVLNFIGPHCLLIQALGTNWRASYRSGNLLRLWLLDLEPIGILRANTPNI